MSDSKSKLPFVDDTRGVSEVVGFILVFAVLILALSTYQAAIVPQQNAQTEFQHFEDVRNEMIELRNSISTAGQADVSQFPSVTLGTNYRTRTVTVNPPPPAGTLQTSEPYNITIANKSGSQMNISTRFIEYQPGYHEISIGSTWYEHSVLYLDERDRGGVSIIEEQNIVKNKTVRITALQNQFQETGTGRVTLELYTRDRVNKFPSGNLTVRVPTRLTEDDYWDEALADTGDIYQGVDSDSDVDRLNLSVNETDLEVNTVGIRGEPDEGPGKNTAPYRESGTSQDPTDPSSDTAENVEVVSDSGQTFWAANSPLFEIENTGSESATITSFTIDSTSKSQVNDVFETQTETGSYAQGQHEVYIESSDDGVLEMDGQPYYEDDGTPLLIGSTETMTEPATLDASATGTVYIHAFRNNGDQTVGMSGATITITLGFNDGSSATYSVEIN
jgi:hypothetical protein